LLKYQDLYDLELNNGLDKDRTSAGEAGALRSKMKIEFSCPYCISKGKANIFSVELAQKNDCFYTVNCGKGHEYSVNIAYHPFQRLFEIGVNAIYDGYYREAIGSFAASYERFFELFIKIIIDKNKVDQNVYLETWKKLSKYSERQLGAYIITFLTEFRTKPKILGDKYISFRNKVIHQGHIPDKKECIEFGNQVLECIVPVIKRLYTSEPLKNILITSIIEYMTWEENGAKVFHYPSHFIPTQSDPTGEIEKVEKLLERVEKVRSRT
jgi:hypothetical protein